jgi:hypothetical protein
MLPASQANLFTIPIGIDKLTQINVISETRIPIKNDELIKSQISPPLAGGD